IDTSITEHPRRNRRSRDIRGPRIYGNRRNRVRRRFCQRPVNERDSLGHVILDSDPPLSSLPPSQILPSRLQDDSIPPVINYVEQMDTSVSPSSSEPKANAQPHTPLKFKRHTPFSAPWIVARLRDSPDRALPLLRNWSHPKRF